MGTAVRFVGWAPLSLTAARFVVTRYRADLVVADVPIPFWGLSGLI